MNYADAVNPRVEVEDIPVLIASDPSIIAGDPEKGAQYANQQFQTKGCIISAVGIGVAKAGKIDHPYDAIEDATLVIGPDGTILSTPSIVDSDGDAMYIVMLSTLEQVEIYNEEGITEKFLQTFDNRSDEEDSIHRNPNYNVQNGTYTADIAEHYGLEYSSVSFADVSTLVKFLNSGNHVTVNVNQNLLVNSEFKEIAENILDNEDSANPTADARVNHKISVLGIESNDDGELEVIISDSGTVEDTRRIPFRQFYTAIAPSNFELISVGETEVLLSTEEQAIHDDAPKIEATWRNFVGQIRTFAQNGIIDIDEDTIRNEVGQLVVLQEDTPFNTVLAIAAQMPAQRLRAFPKLLDALSDAQDAGAISDEVDISEYHDRVDNVRDQELIGLGFTQDEIDEMNEEIAEIQEKINPG